jgi:hypothetical protein
VRISISRSERDRAFQRLFSFRSESQL